MVDEAVRLSVPLVALSVEAPKLKPPPAPFDVDLPVMVTAPEVFIFPEKDMPAPVDVPLTLPFRLMPPPASAKVVVPPRKSACWVPDVAPVPVTLMTPVPDVCKDVFALK